MNNKAMISAACAALAWTVGNVADAAPVTTEDAAYAVEAWVVRGGTLGARLGGVMRVDAHTPANGAKFYAVKTAGGGTVFTSADTEEEPIMAFTSAHDDFSKIDERSPLWALLARERNAARPALKTAAKSSAKAPSAATAKWNALIAEGKARAAAVANGIKLPAKVGIPSVGDVRVEPLLKTKWYQDTDDAGEPCYSYYTPNNYLCGCVATAMGQVMYHNRFPTASVTTVTKECFVDDAAANYTMKGGTYNWNLMPLEPNAKACTETEREAIGRLTYDAGVSVCMDWSAYSSGAMSCLVGDAFRTVFGYGQAVYFDVDQGLSDGAELQKAVYSNLDAGYPVMFGICYRNDWGSHNKSNGHSIVGDGYGYNNGMAYMHLNMGWAGQDDLWYCLPRIETSDYTFFNWIEDITYNIFPLATAETAAFSGRALLPNGKPAVGATVKIYRAADDVLVANLVASSSGVWGALVEAGTYNVDVELSACGFVGASSNVTVAAASTRSQDIRCGIDASGYITRTYTSSRCVNYAGNVGNSWGNDITVAGELSGAELAWTESTVLAGTQFEDFEHAFTVTGGDAPFIWSVGAASYDISRGEESTFDGECGTVLFTYADFENGSASIMLPFVLPVQGKLCDRIVPSTVGRVQIGDLQVEIANIWGDASQFYVATSDRGVTVRWGGSASLTLTPDGTIRVAFSESFGEYSSAPVSSVTIRDLTTQELLAEFVPAESGETNADIVIVASSSGLPPGVALDTMTGVLSGRPQVVGTSSFAVMVLDVGGQTLSRDFTLTVSPSTNEKPVITGCEPTAEGYVEVGGGTNVEFYVYAQDAETSESDLVYTWEIDGREVGSFKGSNGIQYSFELDSQNPYASRRHTVICYVSDGAWTRQVKQIWNVRVIKVSYVDASVEENWEVMDGSAEHPYQQIADAAGYASDGDVVYVRPGTYRPFGGENREIKVIALEGPTVTFVDAEGYGACYSCYGGIYDEELGMEIPGRKPWIEGFTLMNGFQDYGGAAGANGGTLVNCIIKNCSAERASEWSCACIGGAFGSKLVNCTIDSCSGEDGGAAMLCDLEGCTVSNNSSSNGPAGIDSRSTAINTVFINNGDDEPPAEGGLPDLPQNPTAADVASALDGVTFVDSTVKGVISDAPDPVAAYNEFKTWAGTVPGGETSVLASPRAAVSFAFGAADLFQNDPRPEITAASVGPAEDGLGVEIAVTIQVKDGENAMAVASAKVAEMFEATSDLSDWNGKGKLMPTVADQTQGRCTSVSFRVKPGDGTAKSAFLRVRP